jgi:hypothetical protein
LRTHSKMKSAGLLEIFFRIGTTLRKHLSGQALIAKDLIKFRLASRRMPNALGTLPRTATEISEAIAGALKAAARVRKEVWQRKFRALLKV